MPVLPIDTGRYGRGRFKAIFDDERRLRLMAHVEAVVARVQEELGIIPHGVAEEIQAATERLRPDRVRELEARLGHETAALVEALSELCGPGAKPWVHYGLTSQDVLDTTLGLQLKEALPQLGEGLRGLLAALVDKAEAYSTLPAVGRTHGQRAGVIAFGLRFAVWADMVMRLLERLNELASRCLVLKVRGVVGTGGGLGPRALEVERRVGELLGLRPVRACGQVVPRDFLADIIYFTALAASVLDAMATTLRLLQRSEVGEVEEPFREEQVGSSAVPAKRNPVRCERISSLARLLRPLVLVALENLVLWEERDLTNSANERFLAPTALILLDYLIHEARLVVEGLTIREKRIRENLETGGEIFAEVLLYKLASRGVERVEAHRWLREADAEARRRGTGFLVEVARHPKIAAHLSPEDLEGLNAEGLLGASQEIVRGVVASAKKYLTGSEA